MAANERMPPRGLGADPCGAYRFGVEIRNHVVAAFSEASGLAAETEVETLREGGVNDRELQLPGPTRFAARLVLRRGLSDRQALWEWYREVVSGRIVRRDVSILLFDLVGDEKRRWEFAGACPVKWTGPELRAAASEVAFESVEFVHRGLQWTR